MAIFKGETSDAKREVIFALVDINDDLARVAGHTFATGEIKIAAPASSLANADITRIREIGGGSYALRLTDAQVANAGAGVLTIDPSLSAAVPASIAFSVDDPDDFGDDTAASPTPGTLLPAGLVTLASLRNLIRLRGDYLSSLTYDDDYLNLEIQAAWVELFELIDDTNENWWDTEGSVSTVANQQYISLPSTCKRVQAIDIIVGTEPVELKQIAKGRRNAYGSGIGRPTSYRLSSRGIELFPKPDAVYSLRVTFSPICPALDEEDGIELYGLEEYIVVGALYRIDQRAESSMIQARFTELMRQKERVIKAASARKQQEPEYLNLREYDIEPMWEFD